MALEDVNDKDKASALNGEMLDGNALKIDLAGNKPKRDSNIGRCYLYKWLSENLDWNLNLVYIVLYGFTV